MAHHVAPDGKIYVDTAFLNATNRVSELEVRHMGFGEFSLNSPWGEIEVDRMRGKDFPGKSGRSHQFYDTKGGTKGAKRVIALMEKKGLSDRVAAVTARVAERFKTAVGMPRWQEVPSLDATLLAKAQGVKFMYMTKGPGTFAGFEAHRYLDPPDEWAGQRLRGGVRYNAQRAKTYSSSQILALFQQGGVTGDENNPVRVTMTSIFKEARKQGKIASTDGLASELNRIIAYSQEPQPSREALSQQLQALASRL